MLQKVNTGYGSMKLVVKRHSQRKTVPIAFLCDVYFGNLCDGFVLGIGCNRGLHE